MTRNHPGPEAVKDALVEVETHDLPEIPSIRTVKILDSVIQLPYRVNDREVLDVAWEPGQPAHGEMRSDDHVSTYRLRHHYPCPECEGQTALYDYDVYHHISGDILHKCTACGEIYTERHW